MRLARCFWERALLVGISSAVWSCADPGRYVWARDVPQAPQLAEQVYVIHTGDLLDVRVYNEERLAGRPRVRSDGKITLPLIGDVVARGKTPPQLAQELQVALSKYLNAPTVTVGVDDSRPVTITMIGEFGRAGVVTLTPDSGLAQAVAAGGGFTDYADRDAIFVIRGNQRIRFRYRDLLHNDPATIGFKLLDGDVVTVE